MEAFDKNELVTILSSKIVYHTNESEVLALEIAILQGRLEYHNKMKETTQGKVTRLVEGVSV